eukprot:3841508-Pleurochrysis_carterae.AAC.1
MVGANSARTMFQDFSIPKQHHVRRLWRVCTGTGTRGRAVWWRPPRYQVGGGCVWVCASAAMCEFCVSVA